MGISSTVFGVRAGGGPKRCNQSTCEGGRGKDCTLPHQTPEFGFGDPRSGLRVGFRVQGLDLRFRTYDLWFGL